MPTQELLFNYCNCCKELKPYLKFDPRRKICRMCRQNNVMFPAIQQRKELREQGLIKCDFCNKIKRVEDFRNRSRNCKRCEIAKYKETRLAWRKRNKIVEKYMLTSARARAKKQKVPFDLTVDDIKIPKICPILGIEIKAANGKPSMNSPSLDKIIPEKGYVKTNVCVISLRANLIKNDGTAEEHDKISEYIKKNQNNPHE